MSLDFHAAVRYGVFVRLGQGNLDLMRVPDALRDLQFLRLGCR
jgi:hypothetical protein